MMPSKPELKFIRSLHQKKFREQENCFIAEGAKVVEELLQSDFAVKNIYAVGDFARQLLAQHKKLNEKTVTVTEDELKKISALATPNKVLAVAEIPAKEIKFSSVSNSLSLALDNVSDPGNLGTSIRIAHWFGIENIICSENCVDAYNPKVVQAAMGSLFFMNVAQTNLNRFFSGAESNIPVYGTMLNGKSIYESNLSSPAIILLGNESTGISDELKTYITHPVTIPSAVPKGKHKPDSLNVATAAAVVCAAFRR